MAHDLFNEKRNLPGAVMVHLQHTPLRKQESIHLWSWATHWVRRCCIQECSIIIKSFFREYKELLKKNKKLFKHSTRSTYISQVEQWWQRSGLTIWQWSQYRMACWEKMEKKKSGQMQFLYNGLKEDIKKIQGKVTIINEKRPKLQWRKLARPWCSFNTDHWAILTKWNGRQKRPLLFAVRIFNPDLLICAAVLDASPPPAVRVYTGRLLATFFRISCCVSTRSSRSYNSFSALGKMNWRQRESHTDTFNNMAL